jgi:ornithine carbamoyltransferase
MEEPLASAAENARRSGGQLAILDSMDAAFDGADLVYPKSWGPYELMLARRDANRARDVRRLAEIEREALERNAAHRDWICDERRMARTAGGHALYLHCLPADIGDEVSPGVMESARLDVARQANKKLWVVMALLAVAKVGNLAQRLEDSR